METGILTISDAPRAEGRVRRRDGRAGGAQEPDRGRCERRGAGHGGGRRHQVDRGSHPNVLVDGFSGLNQKAAGYEGSHVLRWTQLQPRV